MNDDQYSRDGVQIVRLESDHLRVEVAPSVGGRIVSLVEKAGGNEFLWHHPELKLKASPAGSQYDPNFYGGIDELLPDDISPTIDGLESFDHGELWTLPLAWELAGQRLKLRGDLPRFGLRYEREMSLRTDGAWLDTSYRLSNIAKAPRTFLWKFHAALRIDAGDVIDCPARRAQVVDLSWSRYRTKEPFDWPWISGQNASVVPPADGTTDLFALSELGAGRMTLRRPKRGLAFSYHFDTAVFPYAWVFATYGGFEGHYTVILEPCTALPLSGNGAAAAKRCSVIQPGQTLETRVSIQAQREK